MRCERCGKELLHDARHCIYCGHRIGDPLPVAQSTATGGAQGLSAPKKGAASAADGKLDVKHAAMILVAIVAIIVAVFYGWQKLAVVQDEQVAYDKAHVSMSFGITVEIPSEATGTLTPIPVRIEGTDLDGTVVAEDRYFVEGSLQTSLLQGEYTLTPAGALATSEGYYMAPVTQAVNLVIDEDGVWVDGVEGADVVLEYALRVPEEVTDNQIQELYNWLYVSGIGEQEANEFRVAVTYLRETRLEQISNENAEQAAEIARKAAEEEAKAKNHVSTDTFEFDIPQYWWNRVEYTVGVDETYSTPAVSVYPIGHPELQLLYVYTLPTEERYGQSDLVSHSAYTTTLGDVRVEVVTHNWAYVAKSISEGLMSDYADVSEDAFTDLVDLNTGGAWSYSSATSSALGKIGTPDIAFAEEEIAPSVKIKQATDETSEETSEQASE